MYERVQFECDLMKVELMYARPYIVIQARIRAIYLINNLKINVHIMGTLNICAKCDHVMFPSENRCQNLFSFWIFLAISEKSTKY